MATGTHYHVDHIRPLAAGGEGGVHHPDNLRVILASENLTKGATVKGKRRKYSRSEKAAARAEFKAQVTESPNSLKSERHDLSLVTGGMFFGPLLAFFAVFGYTSRRYWESIGIGCALNILILLFVLQPPSV